MQALGRRWAAVGAFDTRVMLRGLGGIWAAAGAGREWIWAAAGAGAGASAARAGASGAAAGAAGSGGIPPLFSLT